MEIIDLPLTTRLTLLFPCHLQGIVYGILGSFGKIDLASSGSDVFSQFGEEDVQVVKIFHARFLHPLAHILVFHVRP